MARIWIYREGLDAVQQQLREQGLSTTTAQTVGYALHQFKQQLDGGLTLEAVEPAYRRYLEISRAKDADETQPQLDADAEQRIAQIGRQLEAMGAFKHLSWRGRGMYNKKLIVLLALLIVGKEKPD